MPGCRGREQSEAARYLPTSSGEVVAYGLTLDSDAPPQAVAWVLLQAVREDVRHPVGSPEWQDIMKLQCRLADVDLLRGELQGGLLSESEREEFIFELIKNWGSKLNYYIDAFDDDLDTARQRMTVAEGVDLKMPAGRQNIAQVSYAVPDRNPEAPDSAVAVRVMFKMARNPQGLWRICQVHLQPPRMAQAS